MELLPNAHGEILPGVGHMVQLERPREVTEGIERLAFSHSSP
jgi:pimeloyl-ACP methyl ester carboxylesterase